MRLKLIFLPFTLIIAFSLLAGFVYPELKEALTINDANAELEAKLQSISQKTDNIQKLDQEIGSNKSEEDYILKYVPNKRAEERVIDIINSVSETNVLVVTDISIKNDPNVKISEEKKDSSAGIFSSESAVAVAPVDPNAPTEGAEANVNKTSITVSLVGKYADIKSFISSMSNIDMANEITSVKISSADEDQNKKEDTAADEQAQTEQSVQSQEKILSAEVAIDFYYSNMFESKDYLNEKIFESQAIDFSQLKVVKDYVKNEMKKLEVIEKTKINPFL